MNLGELIAYLRRFDPNQKVALGFGRPHSYRGFYEQLAFEPVRDTTASRMLEDATGALGQVFEGWKGGDYKMDEHTECWLAVRGECGEGIGRILLDLMLGVPHRTLLERSILEASTGYAHGDEQTRRLVDALLEALAPEEELGDFFADALGVEHDRYREALRDLRTFEGVR